MSTKRSSYYENAILLHQTGGAAFSAPAALYLGLLTAADAEPTIGANYARVVLTPDTDWQAVASITNGVEVANANAETFTQNNSGSSHGTMTQWVLMDAATGGNEIWRGDLDTSIPYDNGVQPEVAAGVVKLQLLRLDGGSGFEGATDALMTQELNHLVGKATWTQPTYTVRLLTAITDPAAGTVTEVTVGQVPSYLAQSITWDGAPDAEGTTVTGGRATFNAAEVSFGANDGASSVSVVGFALHDGTAVRHIKRRAQSWPVGATYKYPASSLYLGAA